MYVHMCTCMCPSNSIFFISMFGHFMQTVDQFFALQVPMRLTELNCLLRGIDNAFQVYANRVIENLGMCCIQTFDLIILSDFYSFSFPFFNKRPTFSKINEGTKRSL